MRLNNHGVDLVFHGKISNQFNSLGLETMKSIITFIENYANLYGYPQPGRVSSIKNAEILLFTEITKNSVFKLYINQCDEKDKISLSKFNSIWLTNLNHIKIQKARTDVCKTCRLLTREIMEKRERIRLEQHHELVKSLSFHLGLVEKERAIYKKLLMKHQNS